MEAGLYQLQAQILQQITRGGCLDIRGEARAASQAPFLNNRSNRANCGWNNLIIIA
jgi:hypothetical protein